MTRLLATVGSNAGSDLPTRPCIGWNTYDKAIFHFSMGIEKPHEHWHNQTKISEKAALKVIKQPQAPVLNSVKPGEIVLQYSFKTCNPNDGKHIPKNSWQRIDAEAL